MTGPGSYPYVATLWQGGNVTNLGTLFGYFSRASGINNSGTIVGMSDNHAFVCTPARGMQLLPDPSGCIYSSAEAINDAGVIVGSTSPTNFSCAVHAVVWKDGKATDIGLLIPPTAFASIYAYAINSAEVIVGDADTLTGTHAIIYDVTDGMRDLNTLIAPSSGWVLTSSAAINDSGQILGLGQQGGANPELICLLLEAIS